MNSTSAGRCQSCLQSGRARTTVPGEHKFQPALPYTMNAEREKCKTSLSQAIPVPNSSLYIICWLTINRLPLQFQSSYFLWIKAGLFFFLSSAKPLLANLHMSMSKKNQKTCKPWKHSSIFDFWSRAWGVGVILGLFLEIPLRYLLSFAFPSLACSLQKWLGAVLMFIPRFAVYYLCKGFFFSINVNRVDHFISSVYCFLIWMKWSRHSDSGLT